MNKRTFQAGDKVDALSTAGEPFIELEAFGIRAGVFERPDAYFIPMIQSDHPGSGHLDEFLAELRLALAQDEPRWVYEQLTVLEPWAAAHGMPIVRVTAGRLSSETYGHANGTRKRRAALPVFTEGDDGREAMLPRQCTEEYKLAPIRKYLRQRLGYQPRQRIPAKAVTALVGLSFDERPRMKESRHRWIVNQWPLIDAAMTASGCQTILLAHGLPVPKKSACIYCPFHDDAYWLTLQASEPESFAEACRFDDAIRHVSKSGLKRPVFLHRSLIPLRDVTFQEAAPRLDYGFANECEGMCGQ